MSADGVFICSYLRDLGLLEVDNIYRMTMKELTPDVSLSNFYLWMVHHAASAYGYSIQDYDFVSP